MKIPWPKFSIAHLMVAVICIALLIPDGLHSILATFVPLVVVYVLPVIFMLAMDESPRRRTAFLALAILCFILHWMLALIFSISSFHVADWKAIFPLSHLVFFMPAQILGPLYLARKLFDRAPICSGEILWAWSGFLCLGIFTIPIRSHSDPTLDYLVSFARATSALVLWLVFFGRGPVKSETRWPHYLGWALVEYNAIVWGSVGAKSLFR